MLSQWRFHQKVCMLNISCTVHPKDVNLIMTVYTNKQRNTIRVNYEYFVIQKQLRLSPFVLSNWRSAST